MFWVYWDQIGVVYYKLLNPEKTVNAQRYRQQMNSLNHSVIKKRPEWARRHGKVILLHDHVPPQASKLVMKLLGWNIIQLQPYFPDLAPSDYYHFATLGNALAEQHFSNFEEAGKWLDKWFAVKGKKNLRQGIHNSAIR